MRETLACWIACGRLVSSRARSFSCVSCEVMRSIFQQKHKGQLCALVQNAVGTTSACVRCFALRCVNRTVPLHSARGSERLATTPLFVYRVRIVDVREGIALSASSIGGAHSSIDFVIDRDAPLGPIGRCCRRCPRRAVSYRTRGLLARRLAALLCQPLRVCLSRRC